MQSVDHIIEILQKDKDFLRTKYGVTIIGVFGSYARNQHTLSSDIDILIELEKPIGLKYYELWEYLENLLGCQVDLVRKSNVRSELKDEIMREVVYL